MQVSKVYIEYASYDTAFSKREINVLALLDRKLAEPTADYPTCIVCMDRPTDVVLVPCGHQGGFIVVGQILPLVKLILVAMSILK